MRVASTPSRSSVQFTAGLLSGCPGGGPRPLDTPETWEQLKAGAQTANHRSVALRTDPCPADAEETAEAYAMGRLTDEEVTAFEEHCLLCQECMDNVEGAERYVQSMRAAAEVLKEQSALPSPMEFELAASAEAVRHLGLTDEKPSNSASDALAQERFCWAALAYSPPGRVVEIGYLVWDEARTGVSLLLRFDWRSIVEPEDTEYFDGLLQMISESVAEGEASDIIRLFEESSNVLRMAERAQTGSTEATREKQGLEAGVKVRTAASGY